MTKKIILAVFMAMVVPVLFCSSSALALEETSDIIFAPLEPRIPDILDDLAELQIVIAQMDMALREFRRVPDAEMSEMDKKMLASCETRITLLKKIQGTIMLNSFSDPAYANELIQVSKMHLNTVWVWPALLGLHKFRI